jgi:hypothetical protein
VLVLRERRRRRPPARSPEGMLAHVIQQLAKIAGQDG